MAASSDSVVFWPGRLVQSGVRFVEGVVQSEFPSTAPAWGIRTNGAQVAATTCLNTGFWTRPFAGAAARIWSASEAAWTRRWW